jgi:hypothetical protein
MHEAQDDLFYHLDMRYTWDITLSFFKHLTLLYNDILHSCYTHNIFFKGVSESFAVF